MSIQLLIPTWSLNNHNNQKKEKTYLTFLFFFFLSFFDSNFFGQSQKSHFFSSPFWLAHRQRLNRATTYLCVCVCLSVINDTDRSRHHQAGWKKSICNNLRNSAARPFCCCCCSLLLLYKSSRKKKKKEKLPP